MAGPLLAGLFATGYALPIPHVPLSVTLTLVPNAADVCVCNEDGSAIIGMTPDLATGFPGQRGRSNAWSIKDPELVCSMIVLNASVSSQFDKELASSGLVLEFRSYQMVTQAILNPQAQLAFHVAKSNITDVYFCFDHEFSALSGTVDAAGAGATTVKPWYPVASGAGDHQIAISDDRADLQKNNFNPLMQTEGRRHLKRVNFLPWPEYLTSCGLGSTDAIRAQATKSPQWRLMLGSKPIPENFVSGSREALGLLKESLGIASARDGTSTGGLTYDLTKHISGVNFEKAVGGLRGQGISTRNGGSPIILQLKNFGWPGNVPAAPNAHVAQMSAVLMIVVFSIDVICRTGSVEVRE